MSQEYNLDTSNHFTEVEAVSNLQREHGGERMYAKGLKEPNFYLEAEELNIEEVINGKRYVFKKKAGQWHCSDGPAIVNEAGETYSIHGNDVVPESLSFWKKLAAAKGMSPDDPGLLEFVLPAKSAVELFPLRLKRTVFSLGL